MEAALLVTGPGAIAVLADRFRPATCRFVLIRPVVARVTARAVRAERRVLPGDGLGIGFMAGRTLQITPVVLRLVGQGGMTIVCRRPTVGAVAHIALQCRTEVVGVLAGGNRTVVTGRTGTEHLGMIDRYHGRKYVGRMAVLADVCRLRMGRVFTRRVGAIVATEAITRDIYMVEIRGQPADGAVAIVAIVAAGNVVGTLAFRNPTIVAGDTRAKHLGVVHHKHREEYRCAVAVFANIGRQRVRRTFSGRGSTIMAVDAVTRDARVIEVSR